MAQVTFKGQPIQTVGELPNKGEKVNFSQLVKNDLSEVSLENYAGKIKILNIFPSIDTGVCAMSVKKFNKEASQLNNTVILNISADLPFANARFCSSEGIANSDTLSTFRSDMGTKWGLNLKESALKGLLARSVFVLSSDNTVVYKELVPEIAQEPNYQAALDAIKSI